MSNDHQLSIQQDNTGLLKFKGTLSVTITVIFLIAVDYIIGWQKLLNSWSELSIQNFGLALLFIMLSYLLRAVRIYSYFHMTGLSKFMLCIKATLNHNFLNNMLPMRSGELSFPLYLYRYFGIGKLNSVVTLFYFRLLDLHVLFTLGLILSFFLFPAYKIYSILFFVIWLSVSMIALSFRKFISSNTMNDARKFSKIIFRIIKSLPKTNKQIFESYFWTASNWLVKLTVFAWIFKQFAIIDNFSALVAVIFGDLTSVLPVHGVAGAGTYEAGILFGMSLFTNNTENILTAAINLHLFILSSCILGAALAILIRHKSAKNL